MGCRTSHGLVGRYPVKIAFDGVAFIVIAHFFTDRVTEGLRHAAFDLPARSCAAEIDLSALVEVAEPVAAAPRVSTFPVAKEDVALVVDEDLASETVRLALRSGGGPLLESVRLFDVYSGPQVPEGKKSLAFSLRMRADDRTLTDEDIAGVRDGALAAAGELGATLRS